MKLLYRYLLGEFLKVFALACGGLLLVFSFIEALERLDTVLEKGAPFPSYLLFLAMKVPLFFFQLLPFAILIGAMVSLGILSRRREVLAMKVSGVKNYEILLPFLGFSFIGSLTVFFGLELLTPQLTSRSDYLWEVEIKGKDPKASFQAERVWLREGGKVLKVRLVKEGEILGVTILIPDEGGGIKERIDAQKGVWSGDGWELYDVSILEFGPLGIQEKRIPRWKVSLSVYPEDFLRGMKRPEAMGFWELKRYVRKLEKEGLAAGALWADLHAKLSYPLSSLVLILVGVPLALWTGKRREGGIPQGITLSFIVGSFYYLAFSLLLSLGQGQILWPWLSAWGANIFFGALGVFFLESLRA